MKICSVENCNKPHRAKGLCKKHYYKLYMSGTLDYIHAPAGAARNLSNGYIRVYGGQREHRFIMEKILGRKLLPNETVHHKNGDRQDNRPENLELWHKGQPAGQRIEDKLIWARQLIAQYSTEQFVDGGGI